MIIPMPINCPLDFYSREDEMDMKSKRKGTLRVVLHSGGFDSTAALIKAVKEMDKEKDKIIALNISYGQRNTPEKVASETVRYLTSRFYGIYPKRVEVSLDYLADSLFSASSLYEKSKDEIKIEDKDKMPTSYVPFRNLIFLSLALAFAENYAKQKGYKEAIVYTGIQPHSLYHYWDTTKEFLDYLNKIVELRNKEGDIKLKVEAPFIEDSKEEILEKITKDDENALTVLSHTWTCYSPIVDEEGEYIIFKPCKKCPACLEREPILPQMEIRVKKNGF